MSQQHLNHIRIQSFQLFTPGVSKTVWNERLMSGHSQSQNDNGRSVLRIGLFSLRSSPAALADNATELLSLI